MKKTLILLSAIALAGTFQAFPDVNLEERSTFDPEGAEFGEREYSLDLFGLYATRNRDTFGGDTLGIGAGFNYIVTRHLGVGAETYFDEVDPPRHLDISVLGRIPLEAVPVAPYGFAGFGRQWDDHAQWTTHIGLGAEYRFNRNTGFFTDLRRVFPDKDRDFNLWRFGVRVTF